MTVTSTITIGGELIDLNKPCDVVLALKKVQLKLGTGGMRSAVRIDGEEVTFQSANDARLTALIAEYEAACARTTPGSTRKRYAKRFRFG